MENTHTDTLTAIQENETYKAILKDTFGGIMYEEGSQTKYNSKELLKLWEDLPETYKEASGGIMRGVFNFLNNK